MLTCVQVTQKHFWMANIHVIPKQVGDNPIFKTNTFKSKRPPPPTLP
jgi:hypothetical protein